MPQIPVIAGLSSATKRPGYFGDTVYAAGAASPGDSPIRLLLVGRKSSAGTMTADAAPVQVLTAEDCDSYAGPTSSLGRMGCAALNAIAALGGGSVQVWLGAQAQDDSTGAQSSATLLVGGTWSTQGTLVVWVDGERYVVPVGKADATTAVATAIRDIVKGNPRKGVTPTVSSSTVTFTSVGKSAVENARTVFTDTRNAPAGLTVTLTGGTAFTSAGTVKGVPFASGAGAESPANLIAAVAGMQFDVVAVECGDATIDATNFALWQTATNTKAGASVGLLEHIVVANADTLTNAASLSATTLNDARWFLAHLAQSPTPPSEVAAVAAAVVAVRISTNPDHNFDDEILPGVCPQLVGAVNASPSTVETALGEGVSELQTTPDGKVKISSLIVTRCRNSSSPDYRIYDAGESFVPDYVRAAIGLDYLTNLKPNNPVVAPDPAPELPEPPPGVLTPKRAAASVYRLLKALERGDGFPHPQLINVDSHAVVGTYDSGGRHIVVSVPVEVAPANHRLGASIRQLRSAA